MISGFFLFQNFFLKNFLKLFYTIEQTTRYNTSGLKEMN